MGDLWYQRFIAGVTQSFFVALCLYYDVCLVFDMWIWYVKLYSKKSHKGGTASLRYSERVDQHCQGSALLFRDRPFVRASGVSKIRTTSQISDEDTSRRVSRLSREARDARRKETKAGYARCVTQCLSSQLSMPELRSEHFTFIRADARETPPVYLSIPA